MKRGKDPPKGQRSIASFVFKKTNSGAGETESHSSAVKDINTPSLKATQPDHFDPDAENERSCKRARPTPPNGSHDRHVKWQTKLLGDETAGMKRIRTQDALQQAANGQGQKMTPLELQVSALQAQHPDCILAIECGYKYRFFGRDAEVASEVLGIFSYPDRNFLTAGVPTATIDRHVRRLALAGYKVGVVQQTESAAIKAASDNRYKPFERKLSAIYTRATLEAGPLAAARPSCGKKSFDDSNEDERHALDPTPDRAHDEVPSLQLLFTGKKDAGVDTNEQQSSYLVCIMEAESQNNTSGSVEIALIAIEPSTGRVLHALLKDSPMRAELESCLMFVAPTELLLVLPLSTQTRRLAQSFATTSIGSSVRMETVNAETSLIDDSQAMKIIDRYSCPGVNPQADLPSTVVRCLAHALEHLKPFGLDGLLRDRSQPQLSLALTSFAEVQELSLSPNALSQLEILRNADDGKEKGSLLWLMDRTLTPAGARLVRRWVSKPLRSVSLIRQRLQAVEEMLTRGIQHPVISVLPVTLRLLPDCERILGRVLHGTSSPPEFVSLLKVFSDLHKKLGIVANIDGNEALDIDGGWTIDEDALDLRSPLLKSLFMAACDLRCAAASKETLAVIDPVAAASGDMEHLFVDEERFADVLEKRNELDMARNHLDSLLPDLARALNVRSLSYVNVTNQGNYLVEVPVELEKRVPKQWQRVSSTKKVLRYRPPEVKAALADLELAEEYVTVTAAAAWRRLQSEFSKAYSNLFRTAVDALAALDCLNGFASLASTGNYVCPEFVTDDEEPQLHVVGGRHPILDVLLEGSFVPNDIMLGGPNGHRCAVITGPNMGGKSCYIRQAALIACMAQAGSFVPAVSCKLHAFDAIYTRMGAADNIALGRSTFLEELGEASAILSKATGRSLVIMDELGRGTSTQDGKAIAASTLEYFVHKIGCLLLFVTHYPEVARLGLRSGGGAACFHMAHVVEDAPLGQPEGAGIAVPPRVTFLYKLISGVAEASYGLNVARMAGLPEAVVQRAYEKAREVEGAGHQELAWHSIAHALFALADNDRSQNNVSDVQRLKEKMMALQKQIDVRMR